MRPNRLPPPRRQAAPGAPIASRVGSGPVPPPIVAPAVAGALEQAVRELAATLPRDSRVRLTVTRRGGRCLVRVERDGHLVYHARW